MRSVSFNPLKFGMRLKLAALNPGSFDEKAQIKKDIEVDMVYVDIYDIMTDTSCFYSY